MTGGPPFTSESEFQAAVCELARRGFGLHVFHPVNVRRSVAGFPDLTILGDRGLLFRELKTEKGRISEEQQEWLDKFARAGIDAAVWRPSDWPQRISNELKGIS
jgi:hypothetical protein